MNNRMIEINLLPSEILCKIFSYCDIDTIFQSIPYVCQRWCSISRHLPMGGYVDLKIFDDEQFQKFEFPMTYKQSKYKYLTLDNSNGLFKEKKQDTILKSNLENDNRKVENSTNKAYEDIMKSNSKDNIIESNISNVECGEYEGRKRSSKFNEKMKNPQRLQCQKFDKTKKNITIKSSDNDNKKKNQESNTNNCAISSLSENEQDSQSKINKNNCGVNKNNSNNSGSCSNIIDDMDLNTCKGGFTDNFKDSKNKKKKKSCNFETKVNSILHKKKSSVIGISTIFASSSIPPSSIERSVSLKKSKSIGDNCKCGGKVTDKEIQLESNNCNKNIKQYEYSSNKEKKEKCFTYRFDKILYDTRSTLPIMFNICLVIPLSYITDKKNILCYSPVEKFLSKWKTTVKQFGIQFQINSIEISIHSNNNFNVSISNNHITKYPNSISRAALPATIHPTYTANDIKTNILSSAPTGKILNLKTNSRNNNFRSNSSRSLSLPTPAGLNHNASTSLTSLISSPLSKSQSMASTSSTIISKINTKNNIKITMELLYLLLGNKGFMPKMLKVDNVEWTMDMLNLIPKSVNYLELSFVGVPNVELVKTGVSYLSSFIKNISILSCTIIRPRSRRGPRYYHQPPNLNKKNDICI